MWIVCVAVNECVSLPGNIMIDAFRALKENEKKNKKKKNLRT